MIKLLRNNSLTGALLLVLVVALLKIPLVLSSPLLPRELPFLFSVSGIHFEIPMAITLEKTLVIITLLFQGLFLQRILISNRFLDNPGALIPLLYVFSSLSMPDHLRFNDGIWINFVILILVAVVLSTHDRESLKEVTYLHLGLLTTLAILILPSMWLLFPFVFIALSLFVVITSRQVWLVILSTVMMVAFIFSLIYLTNNLDYGAWNHKLLPSAPGIKGMPQGAIIILILFVVLGSLAVMGSLGHLQLRSNRVRNQFWTFVLLYLTMLTAVFIYPDTRYFSYQLLVIPFTSIMGFFLLKNENRWFYEGVFILTFWSFFVVHWGYFYL